MMKKNKKIFVVDDDRFYLKLIEQLLRNQGFDDVFLFESGMDCLKNIHEAPSIVFLDHQIDFFSGYETLKKIKRHNPNIHVVMVSAQEEIQTAVDTLKYGAFDHLQKDAKLGDNVVSVLSRIEEVTELIKSNKPSFLKSIFNSQ